MFRLYAADIYGTEFIDASPLHSQSEYTVVAVKLHIFIDPDHPITLMPITFGQICYSVIDLM
jgi:hypothetical protein